MKKIYKSIAVILSFLLPSLMVVFPASAVSLQENKEGIYGRLKTETYDLTGFPDKTTDTLASSEESFNEALEVLVNGIKNFQTSINISNYNIPLEDRALISNAIFYEHPEFFYLNNSISYSYYPGSDTNYIFNVILQYDFTKDEAMVMQEEIDTSIAPIIRKASTLKTNVEKALYVRDYLALNCAYDQQAGESGTDTSSQSFTIYGCIVDGIAVCQGYALAYMYILDKVGIKAEFVSSSSMNHAWNLVLIDNDWYHVDVTWDDPVPDSMGRTSHSYFLASDSKIASSGHINYIANHTASSTKYDNYFWNDIYSAILPEDGYLYYFTSDFKLIKRDYSNNTTEEIPYTSSKWFTSSEHTSYYIGNFASILISGGRIYYNTDEKIYSMNLDGSDNKVEYQPELRQDEFIYGIALRNNYLYYTAKSNPNAQDTLYRTTVFLNEIISPTEPPTEEVTDEPTTPVTNPPTEKPTVPVTDPPTDKPTEKPTEKPTAPVTDPPTEKPTQTEPPTEKITDKPTDDVTSPTIPVTPSEPSSPSSPTSSDVNYRPGDINKSGDITLADVLFIQKFIAKIVRLSDEELMLGDITGDGSVNLADVLMIQKVLAKII